MQISKTYCDKCGNLILSFADHVSIQHHTLGQRQFELCWDCGQKLTDELVLAAKAVADAKKD